MTKLFRSCGAVIVALLFLSGEIFNYGQAPSASQTAQTPRPDHIILISVDGMPPDYYTAPEKLGLRVPTMTMMKQGGAYADGMEGVYPTVTYPQHTTMVTGLRPGAHGIVQNRIFEAPNEPQTRYWFWYAKALKTETLWTVAKKAGLTTAAVGWPVTVGAEIDYNVPEIFDPSENPSTWNWIAKNSTPGLLEKALGADLKKDSSADERFTSISEFIVKNYRPNLLLIHLIDLDGTHHRNGPRTKPAVETAEREDGYIHRIIEATKQAGIFEKTTFFIVSDHGFADIDKRFSPNVALAKEGLITLDATGKATAWKAAAWPAGGSCPIVLKDENDKETEAKVGAIFSKWAKQENSPIKQIVTRAELRKMKAVPQAALMLEAASGYSFDDKLTGEEVRDSGETYKGTHGYLPTDPRMRASLIIYGSGARGGAKLPLARMIDVAPSIAGLLKLKLPQPEGKPIEELLNIDVTR
ncbi:MAG TPA: ectonucleotide pyrophosphatase/phosphodiesterase [Blastocatellia bacterium]|nr:ectonucleotide pyrophosphatase/phosphodiesterase [Blastocatellia bacterium]